MRIRLAVALILFSFGAGVLADESAYNKGVDAWRAKNFVEARKQWQRSLSEGGPDEAFNNLGYLLYYGHGGAADKPKAVELWRKGAVLAVSEAQVHLGRAYEDGAAVPRSLSRAYAWYKCAMATAGRVSKEDATERRIEIMAQEAIAKLSPRLSAVEQAEGEALAQDLVSKYSIRLRAGKP